MAEQEVRLYAISRYIGNVSINGKEYITGRDKQILVFPSEADAITYLTGSGHYSEEQVRKDIESDALQIDIYKDRMIPRG